MSLAIKSDQAFLLGVRERMLLDFIPTHRRMPGGRSGSGRLPQSTPRSCKLKTLGPTIPSKRAAVSSTATTRRA
jgi:hypothetical protein